MIFCHSRQLLQILTNVYICVSLRVYRFKIALETSLYILHTSECSSTGLAVSTSIVFVACCTLD